MKQKQNICSRDATIQKIASCSMENVRAEVISRSGSEQSEIYFYQTSSNIYGPEHGHVKDVQIYYFLSNIQILNIFKVFFGFLNIGVQGYLKHSSVTFPVRKTGSFFHGRHTALDPKAVAPNFRRGRSRCILWIPIMGFQGQGRGVAVHERWMVDEGSNFHCLVE